MTGFASVTSLSAVQMWARAIAPCEASQIQGFTIVRNQLAASLQTQVSADVLRSLESGSPAQISVALLNLEEDGRSALENSVSTRMAARLRTEALRLDATFQQPPLSRLIHSRKKVAFELGMKLLPDIAGPSEMERSFAAQTRASLAANEAVPFAARCLSIRAVERLRDEIIAAVPPERAPDVIVAAEIYLKILGF